jgi:hypothetical protein
MHKSHSFSARRITQIRNHLSGGLSAIVAAARDRHASAHLRATSELNVYVHSLELSAVLRTANGLRLKTGYRIRGSIFHEGRTGNGFLWAVKTGKGEKKSHRLGSIRRADIGARASGAETRQCLPRCNGGDYRQFSLFLT